MSKYEENLNDEITCPYCGDRFEDSWDTIAGDGETAVIDCDCGKKFTATCVLSIDYWGHPDCELNGDEHDYEMIHFDSGKSANFCEICGNIEPIKRDK